MANYRRNKDNLPAALKTCPKCGGAGKVPCTGREYHQELARQWAESLHGQLVSIPFLVEGKYGKKTKWTRVPGLAIKYLRPGGWWSLKVYISVDKTPNWGNFCRQLAGYDDDHDIIDEHRLYYIIKGRRTRKDVIR